MLGAHWAQSRAERTGPLRLKGLPLGVAHTPWAPPATPARPMAPAVCAVWQMRELGSDKSHRRWQSWDSHANLSSLLLRWQRGRPLGLLFQSQLTPATPPGMCGLFRAGGGDKAVCLPPRTQARGFPDSQGKGSPTAREGMGPVARPEGPEGSSIAALQAMNVKSLTVATEYRGSEDHLTS